MSQDAAVAGQAPRPMDARFGELYQELQRIARRELRGCMRTSLHTTVLVHEAYLRLEAGAARDMGRVAFLALAGRVMRCVLVDHVRSNLAQKRGGDHVRVTLETDPGVVDERLPQVDVLAIEQGMEALERLEPRLVTVVECRFHAGMEFGEIAEYLGVSERTAQRDWRRARAFLLEHFSAGSGA